MSDTNPPKPPAKVKPGYEHWGEMKPVKYPDTLLKRIGNRLLSLFTGWQR